MSMRYVWYHAKCVLELAWLLIDNVCGMTQGCICVPDLGLLPGQFPGFEVRLLFAEAAL